MKLGHIIWAWLKYQYWRAMGWRLTVPRKIADQRFSEGCQLCPHNEDGICLKCGCLIQAKVSLASESCPRKFWGSVKISSDRPQF